MKKYFTLTNFVFFTLFSVAIIARFLFIDRFPPGMQHDEIEYTLSSKTYQMFGKDLSGVPFPASLTATQTHGSISPIPPIILSVVWNFLPLNLLTVHLLYTIVNIATAVILGLLVRSLFKDSKLAALVVLLFLMNPWSLFLSRQALESAFALFFFILGMYLLFSKGRWFYISSFLSFFLGFFSYHGAKLLYIPVIFACLGYLYITRPKGKKDWKQLTIYALLATAVFAGFMLASKLLPGSIYSSRSTEIIFFNEEYLASEVDQLRKNVISTPLTNLFINKATVALHFFTKQYFGAFSPQKLFSTGEVLKNHGFFFMIDALLFALGAIQLFIYKRRIFYLFTGLLLIAPLITASSLNGESVLNRSFLLLPMLVVFSGFGLFKTASYLSSVFSKKIVLPLLVVTYAVLYSNLLFVYYFQVPISQHGFYQVATRVLARYVTVESKNTEKLYVIVKEPRAVYLETLFYSDPKTQDRQLKEMQTFKQSSEFTIKNIHFVNDCPTSLKPKYKYIISSDLIQCFPKAVHQYLILDQVDAGTAFRISDSSTCKEYSTSRWRGTHLMSDYAIESMPIQAFCDRWIAKEIILPGENEE